jgi:hypothetical protein
MNQCLKTFGFLIVVALFTTACGTRVGQSQLSEDRAPRLLHFEDLLGKPLPDKQIADFIVNNNCSKTGQSNRVKMWVLPYG